MTTTIDEAEDFIMMNMEDEVPEKRLLLTKEEENDEFKRRKLSPFSELNDHELTELFGEALRFDLCNAFLKYDHIIQNHKLFGTILVAATTNGSSPDPLNAFSEIFNREFNNPVDVDFLGWQYLYDMRYCSLPVSSISTVQIAAKLYVTTDEVNDVDKYPEEDHQRKAQNHDEVVDADDDDFLKELCELWDSYNDKYKTSKQPGCKLEADCMLQTSGDVTYLDKHEAFQVCDGDAFINFFDKPNGGWGRKNILKGRDGSLELCYVALKYAVDADLEVELVSPSEKLKVTGRVRAYYGKKFDYEKFPNDFYVVLSKTSSPDFVEPGKINLMRSMLAVPAQFSLIIEAELYDATSAAEVMWDTYEFPVPRDGRSSIGSIAGKDCSLKLRVNWKLPYEKAKVPSSPVCSLPPFSSNSSVGRLTERRKSGDHTTSSMADSDDGDNRWSLQEEIEKVFNTSLERTFNLKEEGSCSIFTCTKEDDGDYLCTSVLHIWPQLRDTSYKGPKHAGLAVKDNIMGSEYKDMMERCVVCGPGFVKFKLSRTWIAKSIQQMFTDGIDTWAPKLSLEKAIIYFSSQNITDEMHMSHVTDVGQQDYIGMCISAAKRAGWLTEDHSKYLLGHVGSGLAQFDDFIIFWALSTRVDNLVGLLDEAKGCCKAFLAGQGMADGWTAEGLDHAAEALRYGLVKYAGLKNNRLANYTFDFDQMFNREGYTAVYIQFTHALICLIMRDFSEEIKKLKAEELVLKDDDERELGLHLLRFTEVLGEVCTSLGSHILREYLFVLCVKFNNLNVGQDGVSSEETRRLSLCEATEVVVRKCFDLLGIVPISSI